MSSKPLSETRKADRPKMAKMLANALNAIVPDVAKIVPSDFRRHAIEVRIRHERGAYITVDFDGESCQPNIFVQTWNIDMASDARFSDVLGHVNPHHFAKCNVVCHGMDNLIFALSRDLRALADGSAYSEAREKAIIAKEGTAAERNARWAIYFAEEQAARAQRDAAA